MKNIKKIIGSALIATAFAATSVGTTFALFTDEAKTTITVGSGIVDIERTIALKHYQSSVDGKDLDISNNSYTNPDVGSSFSINAQGEVVISHMVPGDKLTVDVTAKNKSNVITKIRYKVGHALVSGKDDLYPALELGFAKDDSSSGVANLFKWQTKPASTVAEGYDLEKMTITVEFPNHGNEITAREQGIDNQYQDCACVLSFDLQAVQGNAHTNPIDEINAYLEYKAMSPEGQNPTMHDAMLDANELEYTIADIPEGYVYDLANDQFILESAVGSRPHYEFFKIYNSVPSQLEYSIYAGSDWNTDNVEINGVGFDAGDTTNVATISYTDTGSAKTNIIRTNSFDTAVTINAEHDVVKHYGNAQSVNIIAVAGSSYHEFGKVAFTEIKTGRLVLEKTAEITQIHLTAQDEESFAPITIANNGVAEEKLPDKITRDQVEVKSEKELVVTVIDLVEDTTEPVYAYPYSYEAEQVQVHAGTTEKTDVQNTTVETALGMRVIDSNDHEGEKAMAPEVKTEVKNEVIETTITEDAKEASDAYVARIGGRYFTSFDAAFAAAVSGNTIRIIRDCNAPQHSSSSYDASGMNLTIYVESSVIFDCGNVTNGKFNMGWNNAAGHLIFDGEGKLLFTKGESTWGLITNNGSGNNIKATIRNLTVEGTVSGSRLTSHNAANLKLESGKFKNISYYTSHIPDGYKMELNSQTGYNEIVEKDPLEGIIFELTTPTGTTYINEADMYKLTADSTGVPSNSTLKLLTDYEFVYTPGDHWGLLSFDGNNITLDLNNHTLTITVGRSYLFAVAGSSNFTITNGRILNGNYPDGKKLFTEDYWSGGQSEFHSVNVQYGLGVLNPFDGIQMTPTV